MLCWEYTYRGKNRGKEISKEATAIFPLRVNGSFDQNCTIEFCKKWLDFGTFES